MSALLPPGTPLNERFKVVRALRGGPLGAVYLVIDTKITEREFVAREFLPLPSNPQQKQEAQRQFEDQAEIVRAFRHPNLIAVWDSFVQGNRIYLITEYMEGLSLEALCELSSAPTAEQEVLKWAVQSFDSLAYLHGRNPPFFMNDLSPRTMIIDRDQNLKIGGFGLHLIFTPPKEIPHGFLAPRFRSTGLGSRASDIYSAAATFYYFLTHQIPSQPPIPAHELNPNVSQKTSLLLRRCLEHDPDFQQIDTAGIRDDFNAILHPPAPVPRAKPKPSFRDTLTAAVKKRAATLLRGLWASRLVYFPLGFLCLGVFLAAHSAKTPGFTKMSPLLYVACVNKIKVIDPISLKTVEELPTAGFTPSMLQAAADKTVWGASRSGWIEGIDTATNRVVSQFSTGQAVGGIAAGRPGILFASLDRDNTVGAFASATGQRLSLAGVGQQPGDLIYQSVPKELLVLDAGGSLSKIDTGAFEVTQIPALEFHPSRIAASPDGNYLYLLFKDQNAIEVLDAQHYTELTTIKPVLPGPYQISPGAHRLLVSAHDSNAVFLYESGSWNKKADMTLLAPIDAVLSSDETKIFATNDAGDLLAIDSASGAIQNRIKLGNHPSVLLYVP